MREVLMRQSVARAAVALILALATVSCAKHIEMKGLPGITGGSPLRGVQPVRFAVDTFADGRYVKNAVGMYNPVRKLVLRDDVRETFRQAIVAELRRNGHVVLEGRDAEQATFVVDGTVLGLWFYVKSGFVKGGYGASAHATIGVTRRDAPDVNVSKQYSGVYEKSSFWGTYHVDAVLNEALLSMVKEFTADNDVLEFLSRAGPVD
jgi:uncharacterized lipoprotein YajG